jgi:putative zinc finger protein/HEAT repeat protein
MTCESVKELADLYLYGELAGQEEDGIEQHLHGCAACRTELERQRAVHRSLDGLRMAPPPNLLAECRQDLFRSRRAEKKPSPWAAFFEMWRPLAGGARPIGALALVAVGFFSARLTTMRDGNLAANLASIAGEPISSTIRSVQPDASGRVQIALDETRRRVVTGNLSDGNIERLMLAAAKDAGNDGLRVESIEILKGHATTADVREALLAALRNDPNPGVRFKALDGLKGIASQPEVRKTLTYVLQNDQNPGVRIQAIDLLTQRQDTDLVGTLQQLVSKESNSYVRQRCERALEEMNASVGTF